jgi:hypothetical protein
MVKRIIKNLINKKKNKLSVKKNIKKTKNLQHNIKLFNIKNKPYKNKKVPIKKINKKLISKKHILRKKNIIGYNFPYKGFNFSNNLINKYTKQVNNFTETTKKKNILIIGLIRDNERSIINLENYINFIKEYFNDYNVIILENDSKDNTRKNIIDWSQRDEKIKLIPDNYFQQFKNILKHKTGHSTDQRRIRKMSILRNILLQYIREFYNSDYWNYLILIDFDIIGYLYIDGIIQSIGYLETRDANVITANGIRYKGEGKKMIYYDNFAFLNMKNNIENKKRPNNKHIYNNIKITQDLLRVKSAFGGAAIYKMNKILDNNFTYDYCKKNGKIACEHSYFNSKINKIYLNPFLVFTIFQF